jgi:chemotaxis family two-component system response regulator Rcp1
MEGAPNKTCTVANSNGHKNCTLATPDIREILLVEDNPADVYLIRETLREHAIHCTMRVASDGAEMLRIISSENAPAESRRLGLIILDLNLPRHDGTEIMQRLRETAEFAHVPVVVLTSSDSPRDRLVANQFGAARYLRKPSNLEEFLNLGAVFKGLLEQNRATSVE